MTDKKALCQICGEPMPEGEEMFNYHGYSGPCPKPPRSPAEGAEPEFERLAKCRDLNYTHMPYQVQLLIKDVWLAGATSLQKQLAQAQLKLEEARAQLAWVTDGSKPPYGQEVLCDIRSGPVRIIMLAAWMDERGWMDDDGEPVGEVFAWQAIRALARSTGTKERGESK